MVYARCAVGERRIHMEMRIDERRREKLRFGVDRRFRRRVDVAIHADDAPMIHEHIDAGLAVGQCRVADEKISHVLASTAGPSFHSG